MGSPFSPLIANLFMEEFKVKAPRYAHTPYLWLWFVDDTSAIQEANHSQQLLQHINSQDPHKQFTTEDTNKEGTLPLLETLVSPGPNNMLVTTVYRKPTHMNQYLHWNSNHFILAKKCFQYFSMQG